MRNNVIKRFISEEEVEQTLKMFNWLLDKDGTQRVSLLAFRQYDSKDKKYHTRFEVSSIEHGAENWESSIGTGDSVLEAMEKYVKKDHLLGGPK